MSVSNKCFNFIKRTIDLQFLGRRSDGVINPRLYCVYAPYYKTPVFKKPEQEELFIETGKEELDSHVYRAAKVTDTCSVFHDELVCKFTNVIMRKGKKLLARSIVENAFACIKETQLKTYYKTEDEEDKNNIVLDPLKIFHMAVSNCKPVMEMTPIIRGGIKYQVPIPILPNRARFLSMRYLIETAKNKEDDVRFYRQLAFELINASKKKGGAYQRKLDLHKQCEANRAYSHYRWR